MRLEWCCVGLSKSSHTRWIVKGALVKAFRSWLIRAWYPAGVSRIRVSFDTGTMRGGVAGPLEPTVGAVTSTLSSTGVFVGVFVVSSSFADSSVVVMVVASVVASVAIVFSWSWSWSCSRFVSFVSAVSSCVDASGTVTGTADSSERSGMDVFSAANVVVMGFVMNGSV